MSTGPSPAGYACPECGASFQPLAALKANRRCPHCQTVLKLIEEQSELTGEANPERFDSPVALKIIPVQGRSRELATISQLINSLASACAPLIFEFSGNHQQRLLVVRCQRRHVTMVQAQFTALYGSPLIHELAPNEDPAHCFARTERQAAQVRLRLRHSPALPIRTYRELAPNDSLLSLLAPLYGLGPKEVGVVQVLVAGPAPEEWAAGYRRELLELRRRGQGPPAWGRVVRLLALFAGVLGVGVYFFVAQWFSLVWLLALSAGLTGFGLAALRPSDLSWSDSLEELVLSKIQQKAYRVELRLSALAAQPTRASELLDAMVGAFQIFSWEAGNAFLPREQRRPFLPWQLMPQAGADILLGDTELATLWHLPVEDEPDLLAVTKVQHRLADGKAFVPAAQGWRMGITRKAAGAPIPVVIPLETITRQHCLLMGETRMGKSTLLENMIQAVAGFEQRGLVVVDPHSDMVNRLLELIPKARIADVIYLNFADEDMLPGLNLLDVNLFDGDPEKTAAAFLEVAHALYGRYWGPRMEVVFDKVVTALALANSILPPTSQYTIVDALNLLVVDKRSRRAFLSQALPSDHLLRPVILRYFDYEYDQLQKSFQEQVVMPVLSKLRPFESNTFLFSVFGQPASSFNPMHAVRQGKILLVRTGTASLSAEYSNFVGSVVLNMVRRAILAQERLAPQERTPVTVVVDESQEFPGFDFGSALATLAKFGANFFVTTQGSEFLGQVVASDQMANPHAFAQVMSNASTRSCFVFPVRTPVVWRRPSSSGTWNHKA